VGVIARALLNLAGLLVRLARRMTPAPVVPDAGRIPAGIGGPVRGQHLKLHLGCGHIHVSGFVNVDIDPSLPTVDVVDDVGRLGRFADGSASLIYACHVLEHFSHHEVPAILQRWFAVLEPGGELRISVPDIDRIVKVYAAHWQHFQTPPHSPWIGLIYGGQATAYDYHKTGFNFVWMRHLLEAAGFQDVRENTHEPHWLGIRDASLAREPFGEFVSLNVVARKPLGAGHTAVGSAASARRH